MLYVSEFPCYLRGGFFQAAVTSGLYFNICRWHNVGKDKIGPILGIDPYLWIGGQSNRPYLQCSKLSESKDQPFSLWSNGSIVCVQR